MLGFGKLTKEFMDRFEKRVIDCKILPVSGDNYNLVFIFSKSENENISHSKGVDSIRERVASELRKSGLEFGAFGSGYSNFYGGHFIEFSIAKDQLGKAEAIKKNYGRKLS